MTRDTNVLIVGGGATGAGLARDLALRGVDVVLVERGALCSGTTGRSHCTLHSGARYAVEHPKQAAECMTENRILKRIAGHCVERTGGLYASLPSDPDAYFEKKLAACDRAGIEAEVISSEQARSDEPALSPAVERTFRVPDSVVYPSRLTAANAAHARSEGATILTHVEVTDIGVADGHVTVVELDCDGGMETVAVDHVVNAAGAWAGRIGAMAGIDIPMRPSKGALVAVENERVDRVISRARPPGDADSVVPIGGELLLGTTSTPVEDPDNVSPEPDAVERVVEESAALLPAIASRNVTRSFWGVRPLYSPTERDNTRSISRSIALLDHRERDGVEGFTTVVGGKLTTYRRMAEIAADHVCARLGVSASCRTADEPLLGADDPDRLDAYVREFGAASPADGAVDQ
jgi:glycerol-3-phosphate dehydrogenase